MSPTKEASERQRKAAFKAWETMRRKSGGVSVGKSRKRLNRSDYPQGWEIIKIEIRKRASVSRGRVRCECRGECLKHRGRCEEIGRTWARARRSRGKVKIRITTAHLCHTPRCGMRSHLRAMCEPCHQIYDLRCRQRGLRGIRAVRWAAQQRQNRSSAR